MKFSDAILRKVTPPPFPEDYYLPMILDGLRRGPPVASAAGVPLRALGGMYDLCGMLHMLPMAFGGLRPSEGMHTFVSDVSFDFAEGQGAVIRIYDPELGAPGTGGFKDRGSFLSSSFGLMPRNQMLGQQQAGFKNLHLNENDNRGYQHSQVYWITPEAGHLFWHLFRAFVGYARPASAPHPYLLTSLSNRAYGTPWTLDAAGCRFKRSLGRLGLEQSSAAGLCMYALRNGLKRYMDVRGVSPEHQQIVLHHRSIESQAAYGKATAGEVRAALTSSGRHGGVGGGESRTTRLDEISRELAAFFGVRV